MVSTSHLSFSFSRNQNFRDLFPLLVMASISSSSSRNWLYNVFPSFSGKDVRITFLSHFHKEMERKLIKTFKDNDDIERSHEIKTDLEHAIRGSRISVVVLSKNYASSSWCLDELLEIMRCKEVLGQVVIPVFYGLDPSDVRKQIGDFGKIFQETCKNRTREVINQWKAALTDVANMGGFHFGRWNNEAKMIEAIANNVLDKLNIIPSKDLDEFVGIGYHMEKIKDLLRLDIDEVRMIGIWGPSGIGKTTIARVLFNQLSRRFLGKLYVDRVFLSKIGETVSKRNSNDYNMKLALQNEFLSKILGKKDMHIDCLGAIGERLKDHKILICIDDFDDQVVLDALAGNSEWFGSGSRIIVVTTDKGLLTAHEIDHIYPVGLPSNNQAIEIFCRAAFKKNSPPDGLNYFVSEVVGLAGSLPLGLQVLGSYMRRLGKDACLSMLPRLRRSLDGNIMKTLRLSYDGLGSKEDKAIFRYIACLFVDWKVADVMLYLVYSELDIDIGLKNLVDKSLISVEHDHIRMHRLLKEMGKEIVREQSKKPGKREFIWDPKDVFRVLKENTGTDKVLGISLDMKHIDKLDVHQCAFKKMENLIFLNIRKTSRVHVHESLDYIYLPSKLKHLCWDYYRLRRLPCNFRPENLVKLILMNSNLQKLWEGVEDLPCLHEMMLSRSKSLKKIPDLSKAANLKILRLDQCSCLVELPSSIRNLNKLRVLSMESCINLETLPTNINLESLDELRLGGCSRLRTFPNISTNISKLNLRATMIEEVPWWIENFSRLKDLNMNRCSKLESIHLNFSKLEHLEHADFNGCKALSRVQLRGYRGGVSMITKDVGRFEFYMQQDALHKQQVIFLVGGEKVPLFFTHRTTSGMLLTNIPLPHTCLSQTSFRFRVCTLFFDYGDSNLYAFTDTLAINVKCRLRRLNEEFDYSYQLHRVIKCEEATSPSHLMMFDYCIDNVPLAKLTDDDVDMNTHIPIDMDIDIHSSSPQCGDFVLKEWGVRLIENCSLEENRPFNLNTLPRVCQADEFDTENETQQFDDGFKIHVFKNERDNETCRRESDFFNGCWKAIVLDFEKCSKLKGCGVRLLEDCSSTENQYDIPTSPPPHRRLPSDTEHGEEPEDSDSETERSSKRDRVQVHINNRYDSTSKLKELDIVFSNNCSSTSIQFGNPSTPLNVYEDGEENRDREKQ